MLVVPNDMQLDGLPDGAAEKAAKALPDYLAKMPRLRLDMLPRFLRSMFVVDEAAADDVDAGAEDGTIDDDDAADDEGDEPRAAGAQAEADSTTETGGNCSHQRKYAVVRRRKCMNLLQVLLFSWMHIIKCRRGV